jgi:hypothetical protein
MAAISRQCLLHRHKCAMRALIWYPHNVHRVQMPAVSSEQTSDDEMVSRGKAGRKRRKIENEISTV